MVGRLLSVKLGPGSTLGWIVRYVTTGCSVEILPTEISQSICVYVMHTQESLLICLSRRQASDRLGSIGQEGRTRMFPEPGSV